MPPSLNGAPGAGGTAQQATNQYYARGEAVSNFKVSGFEQAIATGKGGLKNSGIPVLLNEMEWVSLKSVVGARVEHALRRAYQGGVRGAL